MVAVGSRLISWQGGEHQFCLSAVGNILALEAACGDVGIAHIHARLLNDTWRLNDVRETIRLGLIGGGLEPQKAMDLIKTNVDLNPSGLAPSVLLASAIVEGVLYGIPKDDPVGKEVAPEATTGPVSSMETDASGAQQSMDSVPA